MKAPIVSRGPRVRLAFGACTGGGTSPGVRWAYSLPPCGSPYEAAQLCLARAIGLRSPLSAMVSLIRVIVVAFRDPPRWRSMLLSSTRLPPGRPVDLRGDSRRPGFELRVDRHLGLIFLPFWPGRGARPPTSGVGGKELQSGEMRVPCRYIDHHAFGCERAHPTSPCKQLGKLASQHVPLSLSRAAAT